MSTPDRAPGATNSGRRQTDQLRRRETDVNAPNPVLDRPLRRETDSWIDRWIATVADLARLKSSHPMLDAVIDEQTGRRIRIGEHWLSDFASSVRGRA